MKRKFLAGVLALCMLFSILPGAAFAETSILANGQCGENLTWSLDNTGELTISGTGDMWDFKDPNVAVPWWDVYQNIQFVVIEDGVTSLSDSVFGFYPTLREVTLPSSITAIPDNAFAGCENLESIKMPAEGIKTIGYCAFYNCGSLQNIVIPESVIGIDNTAFAECTNLTIKGCSGSYAEIYAENMGISFEAINALKQLPTPTVEWLTESKRIGDRNFYAGDVVLTDIPQNVLPNFEVTLLNTKGEVIEEFTDGFGGYTQIAKDIPVGWFMDTDLESGDYIMQVQYLGDYEKYSNSEVAETDVYTYIKPSQKYNTPTDVSWDNGDISVGNVQEDNEVFIQFFYSSNNRTAMCSVGARWGNGTAEYLERFNHLVNECGEGEYKFRARVMSESITEIYHSDWSEWSDVYTVTGDNVQSTLEDLNKQNGLSVDNALQAVRELNSNELMTALSADNNSTGVAKELAELEEKYNLTAEVELDAHAGFNFDSSMVSVVGAGLNAADPSEIPVFTITKPLAEKALPDRKSVV